MKKQLLIFILLTHWFTYSQGEANNWYFGFKAGITFNNGSPTPLTDGNINTNEGSASISDSSGQLLFYSDGITVWDKNSNIMPNGTGLFGHTSSTQSALIVPKPGSNTVYYLFTIDEKGKPNGLRYSEVNMSLNGGLGSVTNAKNVPILTPVCEKLTAIKSVVNDEYWLLVHGFGDNSFYSFKIDSFGISTTPIISSIGLSVTNNFEGNAIGYLKFSPNGNKVVACHTYLNVTELLDFDPNTGILSNPKIVSQRVLPYGVEFSPSGNLLYITTVNTNSNSVPYYPSYLLQYDVTNANIPSTEVILFERLISSQPFISGALQIGPDFKIYNSGIVNNKLNVINNPDISGTGCDFQLLAVDLGNTSTSSHFCFHGLPQFIQSYFISGILAENNCLGEITNFDLSNSTSITSVVWDFGDGTTTSTQFAPSHTYSTSGTFIVNATITSGSQTITKTKQVKVSETPFIVSTITNQDICGTAAIGYDLSQFNATVLGSQSTTIFGVAYFSSLTNAEDHTNILSTTQNLALGSTTYYAKIYNLTNPNCYAVTNFNVSLFQQPVANNVLNHIVCDDISNDEIGTFDLSQNNSLVLGSQNSSNFAISYYENQTDANNAISPLNNNYTNTSNPQTIFVRIQNTTNTNCFATTSFQIGLYKMPIANQPQNLHECDAGNDAIETFDLSQQTSIVLGSQNPAEFVVTYHDSQQDANNDSNPLLTNYTCNQVVKTIYVRIENILSVNCFSTTTFQLIIHPNPVLNINQSYAICEGNPITITAPSEFTSYNWSTGSTSNQTIITQAGQYTLTVTKDYNFIICETTESITVVNSNIATIEEIITEDWTDNSNIISVFVSGDGDYEYSLNGINYQDSPIFSGLQSGEYTVYVKDKNECGIKTETIYLLIYPKFFTPNNDGYNDTWRVKFSNNEPNIKTSIFDRYGKLIFIINGNLKSWDGMFNGVPLPSTDYWFVVTRENGKEFKGHFTLKR